MSRDAIDELSNLNLRLRSTVARLRDGCIMTDLSELRVDLQTGRQCIEALGQNQAFLPEIAVYRSSLEELSKLLPHLRTRFLIEKARLDNASHTLGSIYEWARSTRAAK